MTTPNKDNGRDINNNENDTPVTTELTEAEQRLVDAQTELDFDVESTTPSEIAEKTKGKASEDVGEMKSDFTDAGIDTKEVPEADKIVESATDAEDTLGDKIDKINTEDEKEKKPKDDEEVKQIIDDVLAEEQNLKKDNKETEEPKDASESPTPESEKTYTTRELDNLENGSETAVTGEHLIIDKARNSSLTIEDDAKLTVNDARDCKIIEPGNALADISGIDNTFPNRDKKDESESPVATESETLDTPEGEMPVEIREVKEKRKEIYDAIEVGQESIDLLEDSDGKDGKGWLARTISNIKKVINPKTGKYNIKTKFDSSSLSGKAKVEAEAGEIPTEEGMPTDDMISIILNRAEKIEETAKLPAEELKTDLTEIKKYNKLDANHPLKQLVAEKIKQQEIIAIQKWEEEGVLSEGLNKRTKKGFIDTYKQTLTKNIRESLGKDDTNINAELNQMVDNLDNAAAVLSDNSDTYHDARYKENPDMSEEEYKQMLEIREDREAKVAGGDYRDTKLGLDLARAKKTMDERLELNIPGVSDEEEEDKKPKPDEDEEEPKPDEDEEEPKPDEDEEEPKPDEDEEEPKPDEDEEEKKNLEEATNNYAAMIFKGSKFARGKKYFLNKEKYNEDLEIARNSYEDALMEKITDITNDKLSDLEPFDPNKPEHLKKLAEVYTEINNLREVLGEKIKKENESSWGAKFKNKWRKSAKLRMVVGLALAGGGAALTLTGAGTPLGLLMLSGRVAMSGIGTTMMVEGAYEATRTGMGQTKELTKEEINNLSKKQLEEIYAAHTINSSLKGINRGEEMSWKGDIKKEKTFIKPKDISDDDWGKLSYKEKKGIEGIEKEYVKPKDMDTAEWDKLTAEEKSKGLFKRRNRETKERKDITLVTERINEIRAQEFSKELKEKKAEGKTTESIVKDSLIDAIKKEEEEGHAKLETRNDKIRKSNMKKWATAITAGVIVGTWSGTKGLEKLTDDTSHEYTSPKDFSDVDAGPDTTPVAPIETPAEVFDGTVTVGKGDTVWGIIKDQLSDRYDGWENMNEAQQTHLIDHFKDFVENNPGDYGLEDAHNLQSDDIFEVGKLFENANELPQAAETATSLAPDAMDQIVDNNKLIAKFVKDSGQAFTGDMSQIDQYYAAADAAGSAGVENIIDGAAATVETAAEATAEGAAETATDSTSAAETATEAATDTVAETATEAAPEAVEQTKDIIPVNEDWKEVKNIKEATKHLTDDTYDKLTEMKVEDFAKGKMLNEVGETIKVQDYLAKMEGFNNSEAKDFTKNMKNLIEHAGKEGSNVDRNWTIGEFSQRTAEIGEDGLIPSPTAGDGLEQFNAAGDQAAETFKDGLDKVNIADTPTDQVAETQTHNAEMMTQSQEISEQAKDVLNAPIPIEADMNEFVKIQESISTLGEKNMDYLTDNLTLDDIMDNKKVVFNGDTFKVRDVISRFDGMNDDQAKSLVKGLKGMVKNLIKQGYSIDTSSKLGEFISKLKIINK